MATQNKNKSKQSSFPIEVVDLFCGIGGLSFGLKSQGLKIKAGYDLDYTCEFAYHHNNKAEFRYKDIRKVTAEEINNTYSKDAIRVLAGCAPCQPFSSYAFKNKNKDPNKYSLLDEFGRLVEEVQPDIVTMENVPQILKFKLRNVFQQFVETLEKNGYNVSHKVVFCPDYGIPQTRKRLVLLASKKGKIELIPPTHSPENYVSVKDAIGGLPAIQAGERDPKDALHKARALTPKNLQRIQATPINGSWKDWPEELQLKCHKKDSGKTFGSVYGRMDWDKPAPTMTTQCTGLGNGRFGHPEQDRAISLREAALIQTFPKNYQFFFDEKSVSTTLASRYIGNAVPPKLGEIIGKSIKQHLKKYGG